MGSGSPAPASVAIHLASFSFSHRVTGWGTTVLPTVALPKTATAAAAACASAHMLSSMPFRNAAPHATMIGGISPPPQANATHAALAEPVDRQPPSAHRKTLQDERRLATGDSQATHCDSSTARFASQSTARLHSLGIHLTQFYSSFFFFKQAR